MGVPFASAFITASHSLSISFFRHAQLQRDLHIVRREILARLQRQREILRRKNIGAAARCRQLVESPVSSLPHPPLPAKFPRAKIA